MVTVQHWQLGNPTLAMPFPSGISDSVDELPGAEPQCLRLTRLPDTPVSADPFNAVIQPGDIEDLWEEGTIHLESLKVTADFIEGYL